MKTTFWLTVNSNGTPRATKTQPYKLNYNEITINVTLDLPSKLFQRPQLQANVSVPDSAVLPTIINAEVADNIVSSVKAATGLDLKITVQASENIDDKKESEVLK